MKKVLKLVLTAFALVACLMVWVWMTNAGTGWTEMLQGGLCLAVGAPVVLDTQKLVFLRSLKEEHEQIPTFLNEAEDLSSFVAEGQTLVFPEAGEAPTVYKNRTEDVDNVEPQETTHKVSLDVYDSQNYKLRSINMHALPYDKIQYYTKKSSDSIVKKEIADAAYTFAPTEGGSKKVILPTSGEALNGLRMMTLDDVIKLAMACDNAGFPEGRNLVLSSDMWWGLVNNNQILKGQLERMTLNGKLEANIVEYFGFKIHKVMGQTGVCWDLTAKKKADAGTAVSETVVPASFMFCRNQVFKAGGVFDMFMKDKSQNTEGRAWEFGFQHRFKADFQMGAQRYSGLVYAAK